MLVHSVFEVDDDEIVDNRLESTIQYMAFKNGELETKEVKGYIEPFKPVNLEDFNISLENIKENDVIICKFNAETVTQGMLEQMRTYFKYIFPESRNKVLFIINDIDVLVQNSEEAVAMLNKMIAHIQIMKQ